MNVDILLPAALAFIMFALGLTLVVDDFSRVLRNPQAFVAGFVGQIILVPMAAFAIATLFNLPTALAVGLMIVAACPGGANSGLITHLANGDTALSISLTAVTSVAAVLTMPVVIDFSLQHFIGAGSAGELPIEKLVHGVFFLTTVPVVLGMLINRYFPAATRRFGKSAERLATALFLGIVVGTFISQQSSLLNNFGTVAPAALAQNVLAMLIGFSLGGPVRLDRRGRIAIAIECGLHNAGIGIFVATVVLKVPSMTVPSIVYALIMNITALTFIYFMRRPARVESLA